MHANVSLFIIICGLIVSFIYVLFISFISLLFLLTSGLLLLYACNCKYVCVRVCMRCRYVSSAYASMYEHGFSQKPTGSVPRTLWKSPSRLSHRRMFHLRCI